MSEENYKLWALRLPPEQLEFLRSLPKNSASQFVREAIQLKRLKEGPQTKEQKTIQLREKMETLTKKIKQHRNAPRYVQAAKSVKKHSLINKTIELYEHWLRTQKEPIFTEDFPLKDLYIYEKTYIAENGESKLGFVLDILGEELRIEITRELAQEILKDKTIIEFGKFKYSWDYKDVMEIFQNREYTINPLLERFLLKLRKLKAELDNADKDWPINLKLKEAYEAEIQKLEVERTALSEEILKL